MFVNYAVECLFAIGNFCVLDFLLDTDDSLDFYDSLNQFE